MMVFGNMRATGYGASMTAADNAQRDALDSLQRARQLEEQVDKLTLACAALWELLKERTKLTEEDLVERIALIDARDGVADGKITRTVRPCAKCGRPVAANHRKCIYCGTEQPAASVFEGL